MKKFINKKIILENFFSDMYRAIKGNPDKEKMNKYISDKYHNFKSDDSPIMTPGEVIQKIQDRNSEMDEMISMMNKY